jgi:hypothetical protein
MVSIALTIIYRARLVKCIAGERYTVKLRRVEDRAPIMWPIRFLTFGAIFGGSFIS